MDKSQILVSVFLILLKCEELTMQNVTFYDTKQTWKYAANFCSHNGGVLESNVTLIMKLEEFENANEDVWIGKFKTLTNWTYIQGCYLINGKFQHFKLERFQTLEELQCQMLCEKYQFYSIKEEDCYCIASISSFVRNTNCSCDGCYKVWEHQLPNFSSADERANCIATEECASGKLKRSYKNCATSYYVICDNDVEFGYSYPNYHAAAEECERQGSFLKWYSDSLCETTSFPTYWTSGTRYTETFLLKKTYFTENLQPEKCYILKKYGEEEDNNCESDKKRFFCRFVETDDDKGDIISIPNLSMSPKTSVQSDYSRDMIIGIGVSITVVILILVGIIFMIRRIRSKNLLSLSTIVKDEPSASRMDSNTVTAAYEQLNKTDKDKSTHCQSYDQLQSVNVADTVIKTNTRISIEEESKYESIEEPIGKYSNALTAEYEQLEQTEIVKHTHVYDPLHYTTVEDDPTKARSNNIVSREEYIKYETSQTENETDTNGIPLQYEQLDITKTDTNTKVYDQLHVTHNAIN